MLQTCFPFTPKYVTVISLKSRISSYITSVQLLKSGNNIDTILLSNLQTLFKFEELSQLYLL